MPPPGIGVDPCLKEIGESQKGRKTRGILAAIEREENSLT
jgi:hypothetical protein